MIRVQFRANHNVSSSRETKYMSLFRGGDYRGIVPSPRKNLRLIPSFIKEGTQPIPARQAATPRC